MLRTYYVQYNKNLSRLLYVKYSDALTRLILNLNYSTLKLLEQNNYI